MKIAIMSDSHGNLANFKKIAQWLNKKNIKLILHCGDINSQEIIDEAKNNFKGEIKFVRGNADYDLENLPESMELKIENKKIFFAHFPDIAKKTAESENYDLVFYGHTHRAWEEKINNCRLINPGESAGQFYKPTFAVYDTATDLLELKILEKLD